MKIICDHCGEPFNIRPSSFRPGEHYCSPACRHNARYVTLTCANCGCTFERLKSARTPSDKDFCSRACAKVFTSQHMKDLNREMNPERMTDATKAKLRAARLGAGEGKTYEKTYSRHTHRVVAEQMLGRALHKGEVVHHIDGNKRNNDPHNLMVFASQAEHARHHMTEKQKNVI